MSEAVPSDHYPVTDRNRVKRLHERGRYDWESVHAILDGAMIAHIAYVIDGQPYCTPTAFWREGEHLYWHGSAASRMLRAQRDGLPVCLTVTHLDSLVLARSGFNHSADYRSAMCFGTARIVEEPQAKARALDAMVDRFYPGRSAELRTSTAQEIKATMVVGMEIEEASAKVRGKGLSDEGEDMDLPIYTARYPVVQVIGAAEPCPRLPAGTPVPPGLAGFTAGRRLDELMVENHRIRFGGE
ncbi:pyridoxamine 5'-phosphate oxidase family protein [Azospirillum brasilense]|uniref:Pyridoxamine 5'-phosphate oxidase family protein n=1 Tax=Azospirillum brasilense TaxID=192 RepID=A0A0P0FBL8_AZOBR|nr:MULTISPECIES: pyridoxamine 5'-phosphate oxidase family protein [Azospirillum]ALJ38358.1 flavin-nucleotide-binding protein [Azospirillum brasilense]MDW7554286.1 pyridoxamine 5'-phosphate oxidase family protein [Azospirillum brasilense]MDW7594503.1 pyridoxamine 5'-phosphate oxidase family protein [Azospirillum brasilense]MDW7629357.1 pyridoxamine 5'-phosphate oxidase family protein [Azospirillum brasilense]MDW7629989.1 pyridoxamine 5'-phosphate oxidase family protein [Azospirillum brasilense]